MNKLPLCAALAAFSFPVAALAVSAPSDFVVTRSENGVSATVIDATHTPFWFEEIPTEDGGRYVVHNNTTNLSLVGFGVTNFFGLPYIDNPANPDDRFSYGLPTYSISQGDNELWTVSILDGWLWTDDFLYDGGYYYDGNTQSAAQLFGPYGNILTDEEPIAYYFQVSDADLLYPGLSASGFGFIDAAPHSVFFGVAGDDAGNTYAFIVGGPVGAVPLPAPLLLLLAGFGSLAALHRRKTRNLV